MNKRGLVWFRNDLRVRDNKVLQRAIEDSDKILPVYILDPRIFRELDLGFRKTEVLRAQFLVESIDDLAKNLGNKSSSLLIKIGEPEKIVPEICRNNEIDKVFCSKEVTWEEKKVEEHLESALFDMGVGLEKIWQSTLFHEDDIPWPINRLPDVFTKFRKENEKSTSIREEICSPEKIETFVSKESSDNIDLKRFGLDTTRQIDDKAAIKFKGGETEAWKRLQSYFWEGDHLKNYKYTRNGLLGENYSSKFSAWLSLGCISPVSIRNEVKKYEKEVKKNVSTYWLVFELIWRDYFRFVCKKYGNLVFKKEGINNKEIYFDNYLPSFEKWKNGTTGVPFIDANMIELRATGFMSNRGRQNVASFLVKDLSIDWRWGAAWFESQLIDYDVCSNWANWMYNAGVGNDPRENRYFNVISQAQKYDSKGEFVRHWIPALTEIPGFKAHHPSELNKDELKGFKVELGVDYPNPLVPFDKWMAG